MDARKTMSEGLWYALKVRSRCEGMVAGVLANKGYAPFLPTYQSKRRWSDRIRTLELPLFPGYLFCEFDVNNRLPILTTPGVHSIVGIGKSPEPVAHEEIDAIRQVVMAGLVYSPHPFVKAGQFVRIERGSLMGLVGLVTEVRNELRLILSVNLLMRSVSVEIDRSWVELVRPLPQERCPQVSLAHSLPVK
jgi:transcription antitermination factor NusG